MRNIEIKARIKQLPQILERAKLLSNTNGEIIKQYDTFYNVNQGRLKLRQFEDGAGELIYYERPDTEGPKLSSYDKCNINGESIVGLNTVLGRALGRKQIVKKVRHLFVVDQTRIHIDCVENLGDFVELEVCLRPEQSTEDGEKIAENLIKSLGIDSDDLISGAYADLLTTN